MHPFKPVKREELIKALKEAGFEGPYTGGSHEYYDRQISRAKSGKNWNN